MAIIGTIRKRSGLLLGIVGLALAAFVLGDLFQNLGQSSNFDQNKIAIINDEKISTQDFQTRVSEQTDLMMKQLNKQSLSNDESYQITMEVWSQVKRETITRQQMEILGLIQKTGEAAAAGVTTDEYMDNITGNNPHSEILRNFGDPKTGAFDRNNVINFLNYIEQGVSSQDEEQKTQALEAQSQWTNLSKYIKSDIANNKYNNLLLKAYYLPKPLAEQVFVENNKLNKVALFAARYGTVKDEESTPTDADFEAFYTEHKNEFENLKETRSINYISWPVMPSAEDMKDLESQIATFTADLAKAPKEELPYLVNNSGNSRYDSSWVKKGTLSPFIDSAAFSAELGSIVGPWTENGAFHVAKIVDRMARPDSLKASHILISFAGAYGAPQTVTRTKIGAKELADSIKNAVAKNQDAFDQLVSKSDDPSKAENNGHLDWFADGGMIFAFNEAVVNGAKGSIEVIETAFGYHVIRIDDKKEAKTKIRIAQIDLPITYSQKTFDQVYNTANKFASLNRTLDAFDTSATNIGLSVVKGDPLDKMAAGVAGLPNSRELVKWMFNDKTEKGSVSNVYDFENQIIVAALSEVRPEGILPLEAVKEQITPLVQREVKARILMDKMKNVKDLNQSGEFQARIDTLTLGFATYSLQMYGPEPNVQGRMFNAKVNTLMGPIKGDQGVYMFKVLEEGKAPETKDLKMIQMQAKQPFAQRIMQQLYPSIEKAAVIEDFMFFFY